MKLSIILPTIRAHLLPAWFSSLEKSCDRHEFEVVCAGPFEPPQELLNKDNFKWIKSFASPTVCAQLCVLEAKGDLILHSVDDGFYYPEVVSNEIDRSAPYQITCMRYRESADMKGDSMPDDYWYCRTAYAGWGIPPDFVHGVHFMCNREAFLGFGGFDCKYDYLNHASHAVLFQMQYAGFQGVLSQKDIMNCSHLPECSGDHGAIHHAQTGHDAPLFYQNWFHKTPVIHRVDDWKEQPEVWTRRFKGNETTYNDLGAE